MLRDEPVDKRKTIIGTSTLITVCITQRTVVITNVNHSESPVYQHSWIIAPDRHIDDTISLNNMVIYNCQFSAGLILTTIESQLIICMRISKGPLKSKYLDLMKAYLYLVQ